MLYPDNRPRTGGFALLVTITLVAMLVLVLVSLASLTRVETQVAANTMQAGQARQNALLSLSVAMGQLQRHAGPDQRATGAADITDVAVDGSRHWTGVWGNSRPSDDLMSAPAVLGWLVSGNERSTFTVSESATDFGRVTAPAAGLDYLPQNAVSMGAAATLGALANDVTVAGDPARLLVGPGSAEQTADYVVAPMIDISVPADSIPGLTGSAQTPIGRYAWWVGDEGVKSRFNLVDPRASTASTAAERYNRLMIAQRHGIELTSRDDSDGAQVLGAALYNVEGNGAASSAFRAELGLLMMRSQAAMLTGFQAAPIQTALRWRGHDYTMHSRGVLADQLRGGLRRDLTVLFDRPISSWTGALRDSLQEASTTDGGVLRVADFKSSRLYSGSTTYSMAAISSPDARSPVAATWEQVRSFYDYANSNSGTVAAAARTDTRMGVHPVMQRWGVSFDASAAADGTGGLLHFFPHVVLWNPYNVAISGSYRVRMEMGSGDNGAAKWVHFATLRRDAEGDPMPGAPYTVYHHELIAAANATRPGKYSNHTLEFTIPLTTIPAGEAMVFTPATTTSYDTTGDNLLAAGYTTNRSFTRPVAHAFTPEQLEDTVVVLANQDGSGGGTFSAHLLAEDDTPLQMIDAVGISRTQLNVDAGGSNATTLTGGDRIGALVFKHLANDAADARSQSGLSGVSHHQDGNGRYNWIAQYNQRAAAVGHAWFEWSQGFSAAANWVAAPTLSTTTQWVIDTAGGGERTYTGPSRFASNGITRAVLFHLPRQETPVLSLGQLQHATLSISQPTLTFAFGGSQEPTYPLGNSYASPVIATNRLLQPNPNSAPTAPSHWQFSRGEPHIVDTSYLLNRALWDRFFFSGTPDVSEPVLQARIDAGEPLPNARLGRRTDSTAADARDFDRSASTLLVEGSFNVNSTSVEAWAALFGGLRSVGVNPATGATMTQADSPYVRTPHVTGGKSVSSASDNWAGYRALTDAQVRVLARAAVAEVRSRGPFLSLADFVNRALVAYPDERGLSGALQAALDATSALNTAVLERVRPATSDNPLPTTGAELFTHDNHDYYLQNMLAPRRNTVNRARAKAAMAPGFLSQADLLQALGPGLSARSDTFVIRAYGEALNPMLAENDPGRITGRAWCEAVVQRLPEYVDDTGNAAEAHPVEGGAVTLTEENRRFGRRFQVIDFRWLSPSEI